MRFASLPVCCRWFISFALLTPALRAQPTASSPAQNDYFQARILLALSDADMVPSAYVNGQLGPVAGADALSVLTFDGHQTAPSSVRTLALSNSVTGPPAAIATTPDGRYAIAVETRGQRPASGADVKLSGLSNGRIITVLDLHDPRQPRIVQQLAGPARAVSVSVSHDGTLVVLAVHPTGDGTAAPLWLYHLAGGQLTGGAAVPIPGWTPGDELVHALFHPTRPLLALTNVTRHQALLAEVQPAGAGWQLRAWGNQVPIEAGTLLSCFSPDGRYLFVNGSPPAAPSQGGVVLSIRLDAHQGRGSEPVHEVVSRLPTGAIPEGLAVSPDGQLLVTVNLEHSYLPVGDPARSRYASLSLFAVNPATGVLTAAGDFAFDGMLPESAVFDNSSRRLAVADFGELDNSTAPGHVDFWRVVGAAGSAEPLRLIKTTHSLPLQRGVHTLAIVR